MGGEETLSNRSMGAGDLDSHSGLATALLHEAGPGRQLLPSCPWEATRVNPFLFARV